MQHGFPPFSPSKAYPRGAVSSSGVFSSGSGVVTRNRAFNRYPLMFLAAASHTATVFLKYE